MIFSVMAGTLVQVVYGHKVSSTDDVHVKLADHSVRLAGEIGTIGATIIDIFPFCT